MDECLKCGECCRQLIVEIWHLDTLREPKLLPPNSLLLDGHGKIEFEADGDKQYLLACGEIRKCPFLGDDNQCKIYPTRPNVCVAFEAGGKKCMEFRKLKGL